MTVTARSVHHSEHMGHSFFFCSPKCKTKFDANPMQYMGTSGVVTKAPPAAPVAVGTLYTCPMHPEVRQDHPGNCPKCGMTLEPVLPALDEGENPELVDFKRRFWWTLPLTIVVTVLAMFGHKAHWFEARTQTWIELVLSLPIVLWAGWPFFSRGWSSVLNRSPNMWTLIGLGTGAAYLYSVVATLVPAWIPNPTFWTYFAGVALIAGGIGLVLVATSRLAATLVEVQGQHDQVGLADPATHAALLDAFDSLSAGENVAFPLRYHTKMSDAERNAYLASA